MDCGPTHRVGAFRQSGATRLLCHSHRRTRPGLRPRGNLCVFVSDDCVHASDDILRSTSFQGGSGSHGGQCYRTSDRRRSEDCDEPCAEIGSTVGDATDSRTSCSHKRDERLGQRQSGHELLPMRSGVRSPAVRCDDGLGSQRYAPIPLPERTSRARAGSIPMNRVPSARQNETSTFRQM